MNRKVLVSHSSKSISFEVHVELESRDQVPIECTSFMYK